MSEEKPRTTEAQKRAKRKYMEKFVEIKVRMTPERRSACLLYTSDAADEL